MKSIFKDELSDGRILLVSYNGSLYELQLFRSESLADMSYSSMSQPSFKDLTDHGFTLTSDDALLVEAALSYVLWDYSIPRIVFTDFVETPFGPLYCTYFSDLNCVSFSVQLYAETKTLNLYGDTLNFMPLVQGWFKELCEEMDRQEMTDYISQVLALTLQKYIASKK